MIAALNDQLLADPDLSQQNEANAALTANIDHALPLPDTTDRAVDAAREEALDLLGPGVELSPLPSPQAGHDAIPLAAQLSLGARAALTIGRDACIGSLESGFGWAAKMPAAFPVYPRAATQLAAGSDNTGCSLRAVSFRSPVPIEDIIGFYRASAQRAGYSTSLSSYGDETNLTARKGDAVVAVWASRAPQGVTRVVLITRSA